MNYSKVHTGSIQHGMGGGGGGGGGGEKEHWGMHLSGGGGLPIDRVYSA